MFYHWRNSQVKQNDAFKMFRFQPTKMRECTDIQCNVVLKHKHPSYLTAIFSTSSSCKSTRYQHKIPSSQHYNRLNQQLINAFNTLPITLRCSTYSTFKTKLKSFLLTHITWAHNLNHHITYTFCVYFYHP